MKARLSAATAQKTPAEHVCSLCGHHWKSVDCDTAKKVQQAARVNGHGPFCHLCFHLEMASRYAKNRGYGMLRDAVEVWMQNGAKYLDQHP